MLAQVSSVHEQLTNSRMQELLLIRSSPRSLASCCVLVQTATMIMTSTALYMYLLCKVLKQRTRTVYMSTCTMLLAC